MPEDKKNCSCCEQNITEADAEYAAELVKLATKKLPYDYIPASVVVCLDNKKTVQTNIAYLLDRLAEVETEVTKLKRVHAKPKGPK